jgi:hypothetical protein
MIKGILEIYENLREQLEKNNAGIITGMTSYYSVNPDAHTGKGLHKYSGGNVYTLNLQRMNGMSDRLFITSGKIKGKSKSGNITLKDDKFHVEILYPLMVSVKDANGKPTKEFRGWRWTKAYSISQVSDADVSKVQALIRASGFDPFAIEEPEKVLAAIEKIAGSTEVIPEMFADTREYYREAFRKASRNLSLKNKDGKKELDPIVVELTAEIFSCYFCNNNGIEIDIPDSAGYCQYWLGEWDKNKSLFSDATKQAWVQISACE